MALRIMTLRRDDLTMSCLLVSVTKSECIKNCLTVSLISRRRQKLLNWEAHLSYWGEGKDLLRFNDWNRVMSYRKGQDNLSPWIHPPREFRFRIGSVFTLGQIRNKLLFYVVVLALFLVLPPFSYFSFYLDSILLFISHWWCRAGYFFLVLIVGLHLYSSKGFHEEKKGRLQPLKFLKSRFPLFREDLFWPSIVKKKRDASQRMCQFFYRFLPNGRYHSQPESPILCWKENEKSPDWIRTFHATINTDFNPIPFSPI